jgi:hypothetical protein
MEMKYPGQLLLSVVGAILTGMGWIVLRNLKSHLALALMQPNHSTEAMGSMGRQLLIMQGADVFFCRFFTILCILSVVFTVSSWREFKKW